MTACRPCHVAELTIEHNRYTDAAGAVLTCATCHSSTESSVTAAVAAGISDCAACHALGGGSASHLTQHADVALAAECAQCHEANIVSEHLSNARTQSTPLSCDTCHASADATVTAAILAGGADCASCHDAPHADLGPAHTALDVPSATCAGAGCHGNGDALALHAQRPEGACAVCHANPARGDLTAGKLSTSCGGCHTTSGVDYHTNMAVHYAPDSYETCGPCHHGWGSTPLRGPDVTRHAGGCTTCHDGTRDLAGITTTCANCHAQEGVDYHTRTVLVHSPLDPGSLECGRCHGTTDVRVVHAGVGCQTCHVTYGCPECHSMHNGAPGTALLSGLSCSRCHTTSGVDYHTSFEATHTFTAMEAGCQSAGCHTNALVPVHTPYVGPGNEYPQYADACALCHTNDDPSRIPAQATADCVSCHADVASGHEPLHATAVATATLPGTGASCGDCHAANLITEHAKPHASSAAPGCDACHPSPRDTVSTFDPTACAQAGCHAPGTATAVHSGAPAAHANPGGACAQPGCHTGDLAATHAAAATTTPGGTRTGCLVCHTPDAWPQSGACEGCHGSDPHPDLAGAHTAAPAARTMTILGTGFGTHACAECHAENVITTLHGGDCATCHPSPRDSLGTWDKGCAQGGCHTAGSSAPMHGNIDASHTAPPPSCTAAGCHPGGTNVAAIHESQGCDTCHGAGKTPSTDCTSCHDTQAPHGDIAATHAATSWVTSPIVPLNDHYYEVPDASFPLGCSFCHMQNLLAAHNNNCALCHPNPRDTFTTWNRTCQQAGCHAQVHAAASDGHGSDGSSCSCHEVTGDWEQPPSGTAQQMCRPCHAAPSGDGVPPSTSTDAKTVYGAGAVTIHLSATDNPGGLGVGGTSYRLDGAEATRGLTVTASGAGTHHLEYWSVDIAGNEEGHKSLDFAIDLTAPLSTSDARDSYAVTATIHLFAVDAGGAGVAVTYSSLDGGAESTGTTVRASGVGTHHLEFWSVDKVGNVEAPHKTADFTLVEGDVTPPETSSDATASYPSAAVIRMTALDEPGGSGVAATYHRLDGAAAVAGSAITVTASGSHHLEFWSVDGAGNEETPHKTVDFEVALSGTGSITVHIWNSAYEEPDIEAVTVVVYVVTDGNGEVVATSFKPMYGAPEPLSVPVSTSPYRVEAFVSLYNGSQDTVSWEPVYITAPNQSQILWGEVYDE